MMKKLISIILIFFFSLPLMSNDDIDKQALSKRAIENGWKHIDTKPDILAPKKHISTALLHFYHAVVLDKTSGPTWFAIGYAYALLGDSEAALNSYQHSLQYQPNYTSTHMNMGVLLLLKGDMDASLVSLQKAHDLEPTRGTVHGNLARWYLTNNRISEAKIELALAYKYQSDNDAAFLKLLSHFIKGTPR